MIFEMYSHEHRSESNAHFVDLWILSLLNICTRNHFIFIGFKLKNQLTNRTKLASAIKQFAFMRASRSKDKKPILRVCQIDEFQNREREKKRRFKFISPQWEIEKLNFIHHLWWNTYFTKHMPLFAFASCCDTYTFIYPNPNPWKQTKTQKERERMRMWKNQDWGSSLHTLRDVIARSDSDKVEWRIRLANKWWQNYQVISSDNPS